MKIYSWIFELKENVKRAVFDDPPSYLLEEGNPVDAESYIRREQVEAYLSERPAKPVFIVGAWGSGKTTQVMRMYGDLSDSYRVSYRSLYSVHTLRSAYLFLTERLSKFLTVFSGGLLLYLVGVLYNKCFRDSIYWPVSWVWPGLLGLFYLLITNYLKIAYIIISFFSCVIGKKEQLVIIDDLERSGLSISDQWALLTNLWTWRQRYIVLMGYDTEDQRIEVIERASKLGGHILFLPIRPSSNHSIARKLDPDLCLESGEWWGKLTPRDIVKIISEVDNCYERKKEAQLKRSLLYSNRFFVRLMERLELTPEEQDFLSFTKETEENVRISYNSGGIRQGLWRLLTNFVNAIPRDVKKWMPVPSDQIAKLFKEPALNEAEYYTSQLVGTQSK